MVNTTLNSKLFYLSLLTVIILFFIVEYGLISKGFYAISADESGHTLEAFEWYKGEGQLNSIWLPFYKVINGLALRLYYDLIVTPRAVSLFFGLSTILCLMILTYQLFENKIISLLTGFFAAIFTPITIFSILPLTEISYFFFVVSSFTSFIVWLKNKTIKYLGLTILFLVLGTTVRYEAWIFAFIIFALISNEIIRSHRASKQKVITIITIAVLIALFPIYWGYLTTINSANSSGFISSVTRRYHEGNFITEIKNNVLYQFLQINFSTLNIIGLTALFYLFKLNSNVKKYSLIFFGTLVSFSILSFIINAMPSHNYWRLAMIWSLLLLPFTAYTLNFFLEQSKSSAIYRTFFVIILLLLIYFFNGHMQRLSTRSYLSKEDIEIGKYIGELKKKSDYKFYVVKDGSDKWRYSNLLVSSQNPDIFIENLENYKFSSSDTVKVNELIYDELKSQKIKYLIVPAKKYLDMESEFFSDKYKNSQWSIYTINF